MEKCYRNKIIIIKERQGLVEGETDCRQSKIVTMRPRNQLTKEVANFIGKNMG